MAHAGRPVVVREEGDPKRCFCWEIRLPFVHKLGDHLKIVAEEKGKANR